MSAAPRRCAGFSLIEAMVVLVIIAIVTTQLWVALAAQKQIYLKNEGVLDVQEDARLVTDLIAFDARAAGFMVPAHMALSSADGQVGGDAPDRLCISDTSYFDIPDFGETSATFDSADDGFEGELVTNVGTTTLTLNAGSTLDIDGDGTVDFQLPTALGGPDGGGVIVTDASGQHSYCGRITGWVPPTLMLEPAHAMSGALAAQLTLGAPTVVPALIYEVDVASLNLLRNGAVLASRVEDLQVEYWIDMEVVGVEDQIDPGEWPIHNLADLPSQSPNLHTDRIRRVRISVVTRSEQPDSEPGKEFNRHRRPATGNRAEGAADLFPRRQFSASVVPRNMF